MTIALIVNGVTFNYPETFDTEWGYEATNWANAITNGTLQRGSGSFPLTQDVDFGPSYGLISKYFKSRSANIADSGVLRLSHTDTICWRNLANTGNTCLVPNPASDILSFNGIDLIDASTPQNMANKTFVNPTFSFPLNPDRVVATDNSGVLKFLTGSESQTVQMVSGTPAFGRYLQSNVYVSNVQPLGVEGDIWYDTVNNIVMTYDGLAWEQVEGNIDNLTGVIITSAQKNQFFKYDGVDWVNSYNAYSAEGTYQTLGATPYNLITIPMPDGKALTFSVQVSGYEAATGDTMVIHFRGGIKRHSGVTSFVSGSYQEEVFEDAGSVAWDATIVPNDTTDELYVQITGEALHTIRWTARMDYTLYTL